MILFRFISKAEETATKQLGRLHVGHNSCEGKHFATRLEHARSWGLLLEAGIGVIVEVEVMDADFEKFCLVGRNLDNIGAAYFADESQLGTCVIKAYHE